MPASFSCTPKFSLKMMVSNRNVLFQWLIFRFHVKLQGPEPPPKPRNFSRTPLGVPKNKLSTSNQIALHSAGSLEKESSPKNGKGNQHPNPCWMICFRQKKIASKKLMLMLPLPFISFPSRGPQGCKTDTPKFQPGQVEATSLSLTSCEGRQIHSKIT